MSAGSGRPRLDLVRKHMRNGGDKDKDGFCFCNFEGCGKRQKNDACSRWAEHFCFECKMCPSDVKNDIAKMHATKRIKNEFKPMIPSYMIPEPLSEVGSSGGGGGGGGGEPVGGPGPAMGSGSGAVYQGSTASQMQKSVSEFADHCTSARAERINHAITEFLVGCALPFSIVNTIFFINMISCLNTAYLKFLPKQDTFRNKWVPIIFNETVDSIKKLWHGLGNPLVTLGFDGFKTEAGTHVVLVTETAIGKTAFKACVDPGDKYEDATFYHDLIVEQLVTSTGCTALLAIKSLMMPMSLEGNSLVKALHADLFNA